MAVLKIAIGKADRSVKQYFSYLTRKSKTKTGLVTTLNCSIKKAPLEMLRTKNLFDKNEGRQFYDFIQTFDIGENITPEHAHKLGIELAQKSFGNNYEVAISTHLDKGYLHNHIMINSVSFTTGKKFNNKRTVLYKLRKINEEILNRENLLTLSELKKQNRKSKNNNSTVKHMSEKGIITDKTYIIDCSNKILKTSNNMNEYINRMASKNIQVVFTDSNTYFNYNDKTYSQKALGKEVSLNELSKSFAKRSSHIILLREAIIAAKEKAVTYDEFINIISREKNITVNQRGEKTLSFTYGKRKPVRIDKLGYSVSDLKSFFIYKKEYDLFNNKFNDIFTNNKNISFNEILEQLNDNGIINYNKLNDKNYIINDKKIPTEVLFREIKTYFSEHINSDDKLIKNIYKHLNKCFSLEDLYDKYRINSTEINDEIILTDKNGYYIMPKEKLNNIFDKNIKRRDIWKSLSVSTSLPGFLAYNGAELKTENNIKKIYIEGVSIESLGIKNSWGKNTLSYECIINKINDNKYYKLNDTNTFRGKLREDIYDLLNRSSDIKDFYFKLHKEYKTKLKGNDICIYDTDLKSYFNIQELTGRNDNNNPLSYNKLIEYFNYKNRESHFQVDVFTNRLLKNLFGAASYKNNKNYNKFSEDYFKYKRKKEENKNNKATV